MIKFIQNVNKYKDDNPDKIIDGIEIEGVGKSTEDFLKTLLSQSGLNSNELSKITFTKSSEVKLNEKSSRTSGFLKIKQKKKLKKLPTNYKEKLLKLLI